MLGKIEGRRKRGWERMRWLDSSTKSMDESEQTPADSEGQGSLACHPKGLQRIGHNLVCEQHTTQLQ